MRPDTPRVLLLYGLGAIAVFIPVVAAGWLAAHESLLREEDRAGAIASELLRRTDKITEQLRGVFTELSHPPAGDPCSDQGVAAMRALVLRSNLLIDIGFVRGDELVCSAFGRQAVRLGLPTYRGSHGAIVRVGVQHPLAPDAQLIVVTDPKTGYTGMVSQSLLTDDLPDVSNLTAGMIAVGSRKILAQHGAFNEAWLRDIGDSYDVTFYDGAEVVAWKRSNRTDYAAFAVGADRMAS